MVIYNNDVVRPAYVIVYRKRSQTEPSWSMLLERLMRILLFLITSSVLMKRSLYDQARSWLLLGLAVVPAFLSGRRTTD